MANTTPNNLAKNIDEAATQCVKCGLCLPYCPTYVVAKNENESARGRIALMQGAVREQVPITKLLTYHLDTCLACRACEAVCPAGVEYEKLISSTRAWLNPSHKPSWLERAIIYIFEHPNWRYAFSKFVKILQVSRAKKLLNSLPSIKLFSLASYIPDKGQQTSCSEPVIKNTKGSVLVLSPCASDVFDQRTINDAKNLISHLGWEIKSPKTTECCGALSLHAGQLVQAQQCAKRNIQQWKALQPDIILSLASGCHSALQEYAHAPLNITVPNIPLQTIEEFVLQQLIEQEIRLTPDPKRILIHTPCTMRNAVRKPKLTLELMQRIPELTCISLPASMGCCGAAGSYFFRHADIAEKLVSPMVEFICEQQPDVWVTSNIGCALHIQHALKSAGIHICVLHPISFIAEHVIDSKK